MTNHELDARAAKAMGWTVEQWHERESWCPTVDANHFEEMLREIERRGIECEQSYADRVLIEADTRQAAQRKTLLMPGPANGYPPDSQMVWVGRVQRDKMYRVLAATEALEAQ